MSAVYAFFVAVFVYKDMGLKQVPKVLLDSANMSAMKLGIDPIHFGIMMVVNMEVGMCHPPVGLNLYVASGIAKMGHRTHHCRVAVAADNAGLPRRRHLLARDVDLAAEDFRHDVKIRRSSFRRAPTGV